MIGTWIDVIGEKAKPEEELASRITDIDISKTEEKPPVTSEERHQNIIKTLTGFLHMFDLQLVCDGELQGKLASDALTSVFDTRPDIFEDLSFGGEYVSFLLLAHTSNILQMHTSPTSPQKRPFLPEFSSIVVSFSIEKIKVEENKGWRVQAFLSLPAARFAFRMAIMLLSLPMKLSDRARMTMRDRIRSSLSARC
jgi:hypothetical protein